MKKLKKLKKYNLGNEVIPPLPPTIIQDEAPIEPVIEEPIKPLTPPGVLINPSTVKEQPPKDELAWWDERYNKDKGYQKRFDASLGMMLNNTENQDNFRYNNWYYNKYQPNKFGVRMRSALNQPDLHDYMNTAEGRIMTAGNLLINNFAVNKLNKENKAYQDYWERKHQTPEDVVDPFKYGNVEALKQGGQKRGQAMAMVNFMKNGGMLPKYKEGGEVRTTVDEVARDKANVEAEKGEWILGSGAVRNPFEKDSAIGPGLYQINKGNSHAKGGTPLKASPGDFFFSKDKKLALDPEIVKDIIGKDVKKVVDRTPAALISRYKKLNEFIKVTQDKDATPLERKTATLNIENFISKIAEIATAQEAQKGFPNGIPSFVQGLVEAKGAHMEQQSGGLPMMKKGGELPKYPWGGAYYAAIAATKKRLDAENKGSTQSSTSQDQIVAWAGDRTNKGNASIYSNDQWRGLAKKLNFKYDPSLGTTANIQFQQTLYNIPKYKNIIDGLHKKYGMPKAGTEFDGYLGHRWDFAHDDIPEEPESDYENPYELPEPTPDGTIVPEKPKVPPVTPSVTTEFKLPDPVKPNYATPVDPLWNEVYGLYAANRQYRDRYPVAQRFYEGENIDALYNSGYKDLSYKPYLDNVQRQMNTARYYGSGPQDTGRQLGMFQAGINQNSQDISMIQQGNLQRKMQLSQALAQNQSLKGQYRLQHQKSYVNELEMLNNNKEVASRDRMAQTAKLFNTYEQRRYGTQYLNAMSDYMKIDRNSNITSVPFDIKQAIMSDRGASQMGAQLQYAEQIFKLMQQYGVKGSNFVDNMMKPIVGSN
jgi:hypothetical protein